MTTETACERLARLERVREDVITGKGVAETRFGEDMVKFSGADLPRLDRLIDEARAACAIERGEPAPRRRFAARSGGRARRFYT